MARWSPQLRACLRNAGEAVINNRLCIPEAIAIELHEI